MFVHCREQIEFQMRFVQRDAVSVSNFQNPGALNLGVREGVRDGMREWYARVVCAQS